MVGMYMRVNRRFSLFFRAGPATASVAPHLPAEGAPWVEQEKVRVDGEKKVEEFAVDG